MYHSRGDEKCIQNFSLKSLKREDHLEGLNLDGRIILKLMLKI